MNLVEHQPVWTFVCLYSGCRPLVRRRRAVVFLSCSLIYLLKDLACLQSGHGLSAFSGCPFKQTVRNRRPMMMITSDNPNKLYAFCVATFAVLTIKMSKSVNQLAWECWLSFNRKHPHHDGTRKQKKNPSAHTI